MKMLVWCLKLRQDDHILLYRFNSLWTNHPVTLFCSVLRTGSIIKPWTKHWNIDWENVSSITTYTKYYLICYFTYNGQVSIVNIVNHYGLDNPKTESQRLQDFPRPSRMAPRPIQPPVQLVPLSFLGVKQPGHGADFPLLSSSEVTSGLELYLPPLCVCIGISWGDLYLAMLHSKII